jgi:hypothetical protein
MQCQSSIELIPFQGKQTIERFVFLSGMHIDDLLGSNATVAPTSIPIILPYRQKCPRSTHSHYPRSAGPEETSGRMPHQGESSLALQAWRPPQMPARETRLQSPGPASLAKKAQGDKTRILGHTPRDTHQDQRVKMGWCWQPNAAMSRQVASRKRSLFLF